MQNKERARENKQPEKETVEQRITRITHFRNGSVDSSDFSRCFFFLRVHSIRQTRGEQNTKKTVLFEFSCILRSRLQNATQTIDIRHVHVIGPKIYYQSKCCH